MITRFIPLFLCYSFVLFVLFGAMNAYALINQGSIVEKSCLTGDIRFWPPREEHVRMCNARKLEALLPEPLTGWKRGKIVWLIKREAEEVGFREGREVRGIFKQYGTYPIVEYKEEKGQGRVVVLASVDQGQVMDLQVELDRFLLEQDKTAEEKGDAIRFYREENDRVSPFSGKKQWFMTHVSLYNTAYMIIYAQKLKDHRMIYHIIDGIDPDAVKHAVAVPLMNNF